MDNVRVKLFFKQDCPRCPAAKELCSRLEAEGYGVDRFDVERVEGLAEASYHEVLSTPGIIVVDDDNEIFGYRGEVPSHGEFLRRFEQISSDSAEPTLIADE